MLLLFALFLCNFFPFLLYFAVNIRDLASQLLVLCLLFVLCGFSFLLTTVFREADRFFHDLNFTFLVLELLEHFVLLFIIHFVIILFVVTVRRLSSLSLLQLLLPQPFELTFIDPLNRFFLAILLDLGLQLYFFQRNFSHDFSFRRVLHIRILLQGQADAFEVFFESLILLPELFNILRQLHRINAPDTLQLVLLDDSWLETSSA